MDELIRDVIEEINQLRAAMELEPLVDLPPGTCSDPDYCPIARSLTAYGYVEAEVDDEVITLTFTNAQHLNTVAKIIYADEVEEAHSSDGVTFSLVILISDKCLEFIDRYDDREFPEYILEDENDDG